MRLVNLFLTEDGVLKLGYYGLTTQAECYSIKGRDCEGVRSFAYEVFKGKYKMKSDVWSFGIALLEMMGIMPFYGYKNDSLPIRKGEFSFPFYKGDIKSEELLDYLRYCFQRANVRRSVIELMIVSVMW